MTPSNTNRTPRRRSRPPQPPAENGTSQALEFLRLIWAMDHALQVRSKHMARTIRVTGPQRLALRLIENAPGLTASDLTERLHVHKSTLSGVLQRLEAVGLISRQTDTEDARRQRLSVTPAGRALAERRTGTVEATVADVLREFSPRDVDAARRVLQRLGDRLGRLPRLAGGA
jgi:DNA-binding MarR family transcriptional regulator